MLFNDKFNNLIELQVLHLQAPSNMDDDDLGRLMATLVDFCGRFVPCMY